MEEKVTLIGTIKRVTFQNPLNGYAIINVEIVEGERAKESVTVTLNHTKLYEGVTMRFSGVWVKHPKFGYQLKAESCFEIPPATKNAVERYLSSGFFPGIGPVTAKKIVNHFDDDTLDVFRNNIERLSEVKGMAKKKIKVLKESWKENQEMNNIMLFLQEHMISTVFAVKIYKTYGIESITVIKNNPYKLSTDIHGVGFAMADKLAMSLGISEDSKKRITAAIHHVLSNNQADGHCYLTSRQIKGRVKKLLSLDVSEQIEEILNKEELERKIVSLDFTKDNGRSEKRYYARDIYYDEKYVAEKSVRLAKKNYVSDKKNLEVKLQKMIDDSEIKLSSEQFNSVIGVLSKGMSILTGGPGVGKTTTVKFVYDMLNSLGKNVLLAAPTGRASQRMTEVIGEQSKTIHRLLKWDGAKSEFRKGELDPLECDFVIIDECSMLDIKLASSLLRAISPETQILLVGDKDQLPSVGPGNVFKDLIESGCVNTYSLEKVFRQAEKSKIISYAHQINKGYTPKIETPMANPKLWNDGTDCMFIDSSMSQDKKDVEWSSLRYGLNAVDMIVKLYTEIIPKYLGKENEIQVLSPMNKGSVGTKEINIRIQNIVNPHKKERPELNVGDRVFREGDRVMQTSNNYDLNVFNGDIGIIKNINGTDRKCIVNFGDKDSSRVVQYERQHLIELELAYAITIHKSQGSEFGTVIIPTLNQHYIMLYRNLIYTGLTRARKMAILIGERDAFDRSINNVNPNIRQTSLQRFVKENHKNMESELEFFE